MSERYYINGEYQGTIKDRGANAGNDRFALYYRGLCVMSRATVEELKRDTAQAFYN